jgi:hypothetical protein
MTFWELVGARVVAAIVIIVGSWVAVVGIVAAVKALDGVVDWWRWRTRK